MKKVLLYAVPMILLLTLGCSSSPIEPDRNPLGYNPYTTPFQLSIFMIHPEIGNPFAIPTDKPLGQLVPREHFPLFVCYALAAFDVFDYEPSDWDDWLMYADRSVAYEPSDWDDWLLGKDNPSGITPIRKAHLDGSHNPLKEIAQKIDPNNLYEPGDWNNWLLDYEPSDWDDWLFSHTIQDIASLRN